jgi:hypothetical protein
MKNKLRMETGKTKKLEISSDKIGDYSCKTWVYFFARVQKYQTHRLFYSAA